MRKTARLLGCAFGLLAVGSGSAWAQSSISTPPAGIYEITINPNATFISAPLHAIHTHRGVVATVSGTTVTFAGSPGFTASAFAPFNFGGAAGAFAQYILIIRRDADKTTNDPANITGDWWQITNNTANAVSLSPAQGSPDVLISAGDHAEIRRLTSLKDLFGATADALNHSSDGIAKVADEDVIRVMVGTGFTKTIFYFDDGPGGNPNQWVVSGVAAGDGSKVTFEPDEGLMFFRRVGSPGTNVVVAGQLQAARLTHYLAPGANTVAHPFPVDGVLSTANLKESGWLSAASTPPNDSTVDTIRQLIGTSLASRIYHFTNSTLSTWVQGANTSPVLLPSGGYVFYMNSGAKVWRQNVPFPLD